MVFKVTALRFLLIAGCCSLAFSQQSDIVRILTRAANDLADQAKTKITTGALASGLCFQRSDPTNNKDKCVDQPSGKLLIMFCLFPRFLLKNRHRASHGWPAGLANIQISTSSDKTVTFSTSSLHSQLRLRLPFKPKYASPTEKAVRQVASLD